MSLSKIFVFFRRKIKFYSKVFAFYFFWLVPIQKNKVVFSNFFGNGYGCNLKYIAKELLKENESYDLVWILKDLSIALPSKIRKTKYHSFRSIYELATAQVWIDNQHKVHYFRKRSKQLFIQTWHGSISLKKLGNDNPQNKGSLRYARLLALSNRYVNLMLSNSEFSTQMYRTAFAYQGEILNFGSPRNDILVHTPPHIREKVLNHFSLSSSDKIILYAPTFRSSFNLDACNIDYKQLLNSMQVFQATSWIVLVRLHPEVVDQVHCITFDKQVINASDYPDMQELLVASDILITDYSNTMFEFSIQKKPVFLYASDIKAYQKEREFYFDFEKLPFPIAKNNEELNSKIQSFSIQTYHQNLNAFLKNIKMNETGEASRKVVQYIQSWSPSKQ